VNSKSQQKLWEEEFTRNGKIAAHYWEQTPGLSANRFGFWSNPLNENSLRLSRGGFTWVEVNTHSKFWSASINEQMMPKTFLKLERALTSPYYIKDLKTLIVFDQKDLIMLQLHGGDLEQYLNNVLNERLI
jgi:hypothetical protein